MKITKTTLLFIATLLFLATPMLFSGNASAFVTNAVDGTYNSDASIQNPDGGWDLLSSFYCVAPPQVGGVEWDGTGAIPDAVVRTDLGASSSPVSPSTCTATAGAKAAIAAAYTDPTGCASHGYAWSGHSQSCGASTWTADDPDNSPLPYYTDHKGCLRCHNDGYINAPGGRHAGDNWAVKSSYLMTGHKNMVRMVSPTQGPAAAGSPYTMLKPDGSVYSTLTDYISHAAQTYDAAAGTLGGATLYWIADGWYGNGDAYGFKSGSGYSCGRCHATGWTSDASRNVDKEPSVSFGDLTGIIDLADTNMASPNATSSWDRWGIECSRCHQATGSPTAAEPGVYSGGHTTFPEGGVSTGGDVTAMCANCHRQENADIPEGYNGATYNSIYSEAQVFQSGGIMVHYGLSHGSVAADSHGPVYQFLNSPHGQFTGTFGQIGCPPTSIVPAAGYACDGSMSAYNSDFTTDPNSNMSEGTSLKTGSAGGCTGCHDVHYSIDEVTGQAAEATKSCAFCHTNATDSAAPQVNISQIGHPSGTGTPLDPNVYGETSPCVVCHMPGGDHYFRINTSATYSTVTLPDPIPGGWAGTYANTDPDGDYQNAIWNDLTASCGQCHGGNNGSGATKNGAMFMSVDLLSQYAATMHPATAAPTGKLFMWTNDSSTAFMVNFAVNGAACPEGGCTYSWSFGGGTPGTAAGPTANNTYGSASAVTVTLVVSNGLSDTQIVTPTDVFTMPSCSSSNMQTNVVLGGTVGTSLSFDDSSSPSDAGLYINWGDGSAMTLGAPGASLNHTYIWPGEYLVVQIVRTAEGFMCTQKYPVKISPEGVAPATAGITVSAAGSWLLNAACTGYQEPETCCTAAGTGTCDTTAADAPISYYVMGTNAFGSTVTMATGNVTFGNPSTTIDLPDGTYTVWFYAPTGHSCTATVSATLPAPGTAAASCN